MRQHVVTLALGTVVAIELALCTLAIATRLRHPAPPAAVLSDFGASGPFGADLGEIWPRVLGRAANEDSADAWHDLAALYLSVGYYPEAELAARRAVALAPQRYEPAFVLAVCLDLLGRPEEAVPAFEHAASLAGPQRDMHAWYLAGRNELKQEHADEALAAFDRARDYPPVAVQRARLLLRLKRRPAADDAIAAVEAVLPDSFEALSLRAALAELDGDVELAGTTRDAADGAPVRAGYNPVRDAVRAFRVAYEQSRGVAPTLGPGWGAR